MKDPADFNPYAAPTVPNAPAADATTTRSRWQQWGLVLQMIVIPSTLIAMLVEIKMIMGFGPVFMTVGAVILITAIRQKGAKNRLIAAVFGGSAILFTLLIFALINIFQWGPNEATVPVAVMSIGYAIIGLPLAGWLLRKERENSQQQAS